MVLAGARAFQACPPRTLQEGIHIQRFSSVSALRAQFVTGQGISLSFRCRGPLSTWRPARSSAPGDPVTASSAISTSDIDEQVTAALTATSDLELPEELMPLVDALEQAKMRVDQVSALREALETKAQEVAQLAINAREAEVDASEQLQTARAELAATHIVHDKMQDEVAALTQRVQVAKAGEGEEQQLEEELGRVQVMLVSATAKLQQLQEQVGLLEAHQAAAESNAAAAEDVAATAMKAAEDAVREEMEAAAVTKETKKALQKALADIQDLGISFTKSDDADSDKREAENGASEASPAENGAKAAAGIPEKQSSVELQKSATKKSSASKADAPKKSASSTAGRSRVTASMDEDAPSKRKRPLWAHPRLLQLAAAAVTATVVSQLLPGGVLASTPLGLLLQDAIQAVSHFANLVVLKLAALAGRLPFPEVPHGEEGLIETLWLLLTSVIAVPLICKLPGGSPVLGFLAGGATIGPYALGIIQDVEGVRHLAELGVVFLLFNIGLELSLERLRSMQKYVFGMGTAQVVTTLAAVAYVAMSATGAGGPAAVVLGGGLALSSTAVAMQVLQDRSETGSRHGRAAFAILLLQDLAVVVLLMLIPLLAPAENGEAAGFSRIARALGLAAVKAVSCIVGIILTGRTVLRPLYRRIADLDNAAIFSATTLLVVLGTSVLTQFAGLSLALGAFLAGLLLAETEFVMQVESDIAPFKDLLMGLFFMTVGMEISFGLFISKFRLVMGALLLLIVGKVALMVAVGQAFGLSRVQSARAGLLLAAGGEFAFVAFGEAVQHRILPAEMVRFLFVVVALSMALTPFLADFGQRLSKMFERGDMKLLQPNEKETSELRDHVIIAGFGRVGQIIAQLLSERLIPFVALDVRADRVQVGKDADLPVYFGDAGSSAILHSVGAAHARCAVITLDTPGANYRSVWALHKHFPKVKIYVRAHDVTHGITLEKAGATAVVPETLEPSLQLASAVLSQLNMPSDEVAQAIQNFRKNHVAELQVLCRTSGSTLGYGFPTVDDDDEDLDGDLPALSEAVP